MRALPAGRVLQAVAFAVLGAVVTLLVGAHGEEARGPGPVEIGFAQDMIVHHEQAVTLAQAALGGGVGASAAQLATGVQLAQLREIGWLEAYLALADAPHIGAGRPMAWMDGHGHGDAGAGGEDAAMPGLASVDEVNALGDLKGQELETRFLQLMIRHHQGGVLMTDAAARLTADPDVRSLAVRMSTGQRQETATMTGLLAALGGTPLPPPGRTGS